MASQKLSDVLHRTTEEDTASGGIGVEDPGDRNIGIRSRCIRCNLPGIEHADWDHHRRSGGPCEIRIVESRSSDSKIAPSTPVTVSGPNTSSAADLALPKENGVVVMSETDRQLETIADQSRLKLANCPPVYPVPPKDKTWNTVVVGADDKQLHKYLWLIDQIDEKVKAEINQFPGMIIHMLKLFGFSLGVSDLICDYLDGATPNTTLLWQQVSKLSVLEQKIPFQGPDSAGMLYCYRIYKLPEMHLFRHLLCNFEFDRDRFIADLCEQYNCRKDQLHPCLTENKQHLIELKNSVCETLASFGLRRFQQSTINLFPRNNQILKEFLS